MKSKDPNRTKGSDSGWTKVFDAMGNMTYSKDPTGFETWRKYDSLGNLLYYTSSTEYESFREYDPKDNSMHYKTSNGLNQWYDSDGNCIA